MRFPLSRYFRGILAEVHACLGQSQVPETPLQRNLPDDLQSSGGCHSGGALLLVEWCVGQAGRGWEEPSHRQPGTALFVLAVPLPSHFQVGWLRDGECRSRV